MISSLSGRVTHKDEQSLTLEIGGVGLRVFAPMPVIEAAARGQSISLQTHLVVRENELSLYGFPSMEARQLFEMLLGVNGIGPRLALAILSTLSVENIRAAASSEQPAVFSEVPGVGKKTAQKIILHLADKVAPVDGAADLSGVALAGSELLEALTGLGYSVVEAQAAMQSLPEDAPDALEERLKLALRYFSTPN